LTTATSDFIGFLINFRNDVKKLISFNAYFTNDFWRTFYLEITCYLRNKVKFTLYDFFCDIDWWKATFIFDRQSSLEFLLNWFTGVQLNHSTGFDSWDPEIDYRLDKNTDYRTDRNTDYRTDRNNDFSLTLPSKFKSKQNDNWGFASLDRNGKLAGSNIHFFNFFCCSHFYWFPTV
jgi:hypothetical protein